MNDNKDFEKWFADFWSRYPNDLSEGKKGSKPDAEKAGRKILKKGGLGELERVTRMTDRLISKDRSDTGRGQKVDRWPHASRYLNGEYYDRELPGHEIKTKAPAAVCECGQPAAVLGRCPRCYSNHVDKEGKSALPLEVLRNELRAKGLVKGREESAKDYIARCMAFSRTLNMNKRSTA